MQQRLIAAWTRLLAYFQAYQASEPVAATFRARQLQAVLRLTPLTMTANAVNVGLIVATHWHTGPRAFLIGWTACVGLLVIAGTRVWLHARQAAPRATASRRAMDRSTRHAAVLALLWGVMPLVLFPRGDGPQMLLVATISTGMMCAGGFALATTPMAGTVYVVIIGLASAASLFRADFPLAWSMGALLVVYGLIVIASVWSNAKLFGARLMAESEAARQNEVIGLLLRDFEENASDLLWEIDEQGRLCHISPRLAALFGQPQAVLARLPVVDLLQSLLPDDDDAALATSQLAALRQHLAQVQPFRDMPLATTRGGRTRWWSLSAKPLRDANGRCVGWRGVTSDITETQRANRKLSWMAHFDPLTGLANRHQFRGQLADLLASHFTEPRPFALLALDLDHFKTINDTLGHAVGDLLLQEVAKRLRDRTRRSDTVARLGGDEFAVILRDVSTPEEAELLTDRLLEGLQAPCELQGARIAVRTSIGVAMAPRDGRDIDSLLSNADLALYAAKSAGRGAFRFFAPQMAAQTRRRLQLEQALRLALARRELSLAFQPLVDLASWQIIGFEALLRWKHAELGEVSPSEFVPVAEECGLISAIGHWVIDEACREAAMWPGALVVSVNVSPVQAMSQDLHGIAQAALQRSGLPPNRLQLEITESIFLNETQATMGVLHALRGLGLRIALDDFGTGYSSLAYLRRFPFDTLKIDRSFVRELMSRRDARAIVKMITGLASTLNMKTVAEGVEQAAQASVLRRYGCDAMQGYLASPPLPAGQVAGFLARWPTQPRQPLAEPAPTAPMPLDMPA